MDDSTKEERETLMRNAEISGTIYVRAPNSNAEDATNSENRQPSTPFRTATPSWFSAKPGGGTILPFTRPWMSLVTPVTVAITMWMFWRAQFAFTFWGAKADILEDNPQLHKKLGQLVPNLDLSGKSAQFSLYQTFDYLWQAGHTSFAAVFFIFTFVVPHLKLVLSVLLWFHPRLLDHRRVQGFAALDSAGRWNHFDVVMGVLVLCVCDLNLKGGQKNTDDYSVLRIRCFTKSGVYVYCAAVVVSQILGHVLLSEARRAQRLRAEASTNAAPPATSRSQTYCIWEEVNHVYGRHWECIMPPLMCANLLLYLLAMGTTAYRVSSEVFGLASENKFYTIAGTTFQVMGQHAESKGDAVGLLFVCIVVLCFQVVFPFFRLVIQAMLWFGHFTIDQHAILKAAHEVATMWSALDVSLLAGLLAMGEFKSISQHLIPCPDGAQYQNDSDGDCFFVDIQPEAGYYYALISVTLSYGVNAIFNHMLKETKVRIKNSDVWQPIFSKTEGSLLKHDNVDLTAKDHKLDNSLPEQITVDQTGVAQP